MSAKTCRYVEGYGHYLRSHELTCKDRACDGCQPCTHDDDGNPVKHCTARKTCGQHLDAAHPLTCPRCIGKTRDDLAAIVKADAEMPEEATLAGVDSEAANLAGPAADPRGWAAKRVRQFRADEPVDPEDPHHPRAVLGRWELMLREDYDQPARHKVTTASAANYLDLMLDRLAQDETQDWPLFAHEIAVCRWHLEDVLHTAKRPERGAPCPACAKAPPLEKRYAHHCEREACTREHDTTGASDVWRCPACKATWTEAEYRLWVADDYLENAEALTAAEIQMAHGIKPATLRKWAERGQVAKRGRNARGQQVYDVEQAIGARDSGDTTQASA